MVKFGGDDGSSFSVGAGLFRIFVSLIPKGQAKQKASKLRQVRIDNWKRLSSAIAFYEGNKGTKQYMPFGTQGMTPFDPTRDDTFNNVYLKTNGNDTTAGFLDVMTAHFIGTNGPDQKKTRFYWACEFAAHSDANKRYWYVYPNTLTNADIATGLASQYNVYVKTAIAGGGVDSLHKFAQILISAGYPADKTYGANNVEQAFLMWPYGYSYPKLSDAEADVVRSDLELLTKEMSKLKEENSKPGVVTKKVLDVNKLTFKAFSK